MNEFKYKADFILKNIAETLFLKVIRNPTSTKVIRRQFLPLTPKEVKNLLLRQTEQKRMWTWAYQAWQRAKVRSQTKNRGIN